MWCYEPELGGWAPIGDPNLRVIVKEYDEDGWNLQRNLQPSGYDLPIMTRTTYNATWFTVVAEEFHEEVGAWLEIDRVKYEFDETLKAYDKISDKKKIFVEPYTMPNEMYAEKWQAEQNKLKEQNMSKVSEKFIFTDKDNEILTEQGEAVRSKSEKIIADKLYMKGIPYVYEQPLYLKGYGYVVPDFKILNVRTRKEYYLEHFGMMDDSEYSRKALRKIETFQKNNIFPGDNLLMTFETSDGPLNTRILEELVKKYLV